MTVCKLPLKDCGRALLGISTFADTYGWPVGTLPVCSMDPHGLIIQSP